MLNEKLRELGKKLDEWKDRLSRDTSPEKLADIIKEMKRDIELVKYSWRDDFERPMDSLVEHLEEAKRILKR